MSKHAKRQYTIRNIPEQLDRTLRRKAKQSSKSFNQIALEALAAGAGETIRPKRDFSEIMGSLSEEEARYLEEEINFQHQIDPDLWK
jgi:hypothetical protein